MQRAMMISLLGVLLVLGGCAFMNRVAPSQLDENGNPIPGTHDVTQPIKDIAHPIPYADVVIGIGLLIWNGYEKYKKNKVEKGLMATIRAIEQTGKDPAIEDAIAKLKVNLSHAHKVAGVQPMINDMLEKV